MRDSFYIFIFIFAAFCKEAAALDMMNKERRDSIITIRAFKPGVSEPVTGTAFVVSARGHILTAAHIVKGAERVEISVIGHNGPFEKVSDDVSEGLGSDIAILRAASKPSAYAWRPLPIGVSTTVVEQQTLYFGGYPFGSDYDVRRLDVSSLNGPDDSIVGDANAAAGFSGSPVFNDNGTVVGMMSGGRKGVAGFVYVVPISRIASALERFGIKAVEINAGLQQAKLVIRNPPPARVSEYKPPATVVNESSRNFDGANWKFDVFYCENGEGDATKAKAYAKKVQSLINKQRNIRAVQVKSWPAPGTVTADNFTYNIFYDFDVRVTPQRMQMAANLKKLIDPLVKSDQSEFQYLEVDSEYPKYISMVICPR